jgi:NusA-like KH domain protein
MLKKRMNKIIYNVDLIKKIAVIEKLIRLRVKDCIEQENQLVIITPPFQLSKFIGKKGVNTKKIESVLKTKVKFVEFSENVATFIKNIIYPLKISDQKEEDGIITLVPVDRKTRGYIIGRNGKNLREIENLVKRYFPIKEIKIENIQ